MANNTKIPLFRRFVIQNFPYIEQDFDALTDYQLISKIVERLNEVITSQNGLTDDMNDLETAFNTLKDYVDHYFDNLDVQQEINNKLDHMASDGSLTTLIAEYVNPIQAQFEETVNARIDEQDQTIEDNFDAQNQRITSVENLVGTAIQGTPLVASSTADMTETDRIYVNTTDGHWYYYDGEAWTDGGTYQATGIGTGAIDVPNLNDRLKSQTNQTIVDVSQLDVISEKYINDTGRLRPNSSFNVYGPIYIEKGTIIKFQASGSGTSTCIIGLGRHLDLNEDEFATPLVMSTSSNLDTYTYTTVYSGDYYFTSRATLPLTNFYMYKKNLVNDSQINNIKKYVDNVICDETYADFTDYSYVNYTNGLFKTYSVGAYYFRTNYIEVRSGAKISVICNVPNMEKSAVAGVDGFAFYDENKNFISGVQMVVNTQEIPMTIPNNAKYIVLSVTDIMKNNKFRVIYTDINDEITNLSERIDTLEEFAGDDLDEMAQGIAYNVVCVGDSLTNGACYIASGNHYTNFFNYPYFLKKLMNINSIKKLGYNGATASMWWNNHSNELTDQNSIYIVWLGTNSVPGFTDTIDTDCVGDDYTQYADTETGNMGKILQKINTLGGNKLVLVNCYHSGNHLEQTNEMIDKFAERFGAIMVVNTNVSDIHSNKYHKATSGYIDAVHLNNTGNNYIARLVYGEIKKYLRNNTFEFYKVN